MENEKNDRILNIMLVFILMQPLFDILSFLSIRNIIPINLSTYIKPLFIFITGIYLLFTKSPFLKKWITYIIVFILFLIGHFYLLSQLFIPMSTILHEFRFIINIAYMISLFIIFSTIYNFYPDKEEMLRKLKKTVLITFCIYFSLLIISILTGTSALTYEYSDLSKKGFKGWFDSGQILGHAFSICFPILMYTILKPKRAWYSRLLILTLFIISVSLIGTKVPYYITLIVLVLYFLILIFIKFLNKEHKNNLFNIIIIPILILSMIISYKYTPVSYNTEINNSVLKSSIDEYDISAESGYNQTYSEQQLKELYFDKDISRIYEYYSWSKKSSEYLNKLFKSGKLHPSNLRKKQLLYNSKKYSLATIEYKIFGLGFLNQESNLSIESDFFMGLFAFGILGFILFLSIPIYCFIKSTIFILKNIKKIDLETYSLYMGLAAFFCISAYAGYTYIYTNFSIFLVLIITMLYIKIFLIKDKNIKEKKIKNIDFLLLHLGYGGIESATINSANALSEKYNVRIISFYKLEKNQSNKLNKNIIVNYLYNGSPNREEFKQAVSDHNISKIIKEGIKATSILIKKRLLVINYIIKSKSDVIISTRWDFNCLLSKFGKYDTIKIAQEHHHHNNNKKYINKLKSYNNINYLFALTKKLENDYKIFLRKNYYTKIILMPNMLNEIPKQSSTLDKKNILTISRLDPGKKNDDIIKAFSKIKEKDWKLYIIGDGPEFNNLSELIRKLKLENRVILTGYKNKEEMEKYLLNSSVFLMASITEGLPMVLLEAMSYGIPCIAYETASGVSDIIKDGINGYIIKNRKEEEYVQRIENLIQNEKIRKKFGNNAKETSYSFSKEEILKKWLEIFK